MIGEEVEQGLAVDWDGTWLGSDDGEGAETWEVWGAEEDVDESLEVVEF